MPRREIANATLHVLTDGIPWCSMPHDLPHGATVYPPFRHWQKGGVHGIAQALARRGREREGRPSSPSALVVDRQWVRRAEKGGPGA